MSVNQEELLAAVVTVLENRALNTTVRESVKGTVIAAGFVFIGGLLFGPAGLAVGGVVGGMAGYTFSSKFKPVAQIIREDLTPEQKKVLSDKLLRALREFLIAELSNILHLLLTNQNAQTKAVEATVDFLSSDLKVQVTKGV